MIPSSVPATDVETNGCGEFLASDMMKYVDDARVLGLGETMRFVECYQGERRMSDKLELFAKKHIDGHAPGITGKAVQAYRLAGVENDHECANSAPTISISRKSARKDISAPVSARRLHLGFRWQRPTRWEATSRQCFTGSRDTVPSEPDITPTLCSSIIWRRCVRPM